MSPYKKTTNDFRMIGEFVDEGVPPPNGLAFSGEPVRPSVIYEFTDNGSDELNNDYKVVFKDGRVAVVRGNYLVRDNSSDNIPVFSIHQRDKDSDRIVAVFSTSEVAGIFQGELQGERLSA
jgi:hypothetical protein